MISKEDGEPLDAYLENKVFAGNEGSVLAPQPEEVEGFNEFMKRYKAGLAIERAAVDNLR